MAPRKNAKRVEDEPVEKAAESGVVTPPKRRKATVKQTESEDLREVRLPRAAKNKKPEPIEAPVATAVRKPVKPKAVKKINGAEENDDDAKKSRAKVPLKKITDTDESKEAKPKRKAKKAEDAVPDNATAATGDKKVVSKSRVGGGAKKVEITKTKEKETKEENKEVKPKGRVAKTAGGKDEAAVAEDPPKVAKARGKNAAKTDKVEKAEEQEETVEQKPEENVDEDEVEENGNGDELEEPEAEEPKEAVKKVKGRQAAKKGKVISKVKSSAVEEAVDDDEQNQPIAKQDESHW